MPTPITDTMNGMTITPSIPELDLASLLDRDPYLGEHQGEIKRRFGNFQDLLREMDSKEGGLENFALGHKTFGPQVGPNGTIHWLEWAPAARSLHLIGEFNSWNRISHPFKQMDFGRWELVLPSIEGKAAIKHGQKVKVLVNGEDRISPWASYVIQPPKEKQSSEGVAYCQQFWNPPPQEKYVMKHPRPAKPASLRVYECHVGISSWEGKVNTYKDFTATVLPRIAKLGYNTVQLMAVMEHAYYGSFGYQVTSFFAPSSR